MNRKHLFGLLAFLLVLPPLTIQAQRLTGYEYWFDGKVGSRVSKSLSGYEADIETNIATQHLSGGLHTLYMRFKQSGSEYEYSPVTSQIFFKHNADEGGKIEYWFDDDISNSATVSLPSTAIDDTVNVALTMANAIKFPLGFHQLNIRVSTEGKSLSNIYTTHVLKVPSGEIDAIEYWVDGDYSTRKTVEGHVASTDDKAYIFTNPFDLSGVPSGPHRIYYRPASKNGNACGAVSMATVIVGGGTPTKIEYWFDDDVAHSATMALPATALSDTVVVALAMNNSEKFPLGMHQLSMRMVTDSREQSPIYTARVLKKASGKIDVIEYWVDDWVDENGVAHPKSITGKTASNDENAFVFNNTFDLSDASEGYHRVYYRATSDNGNANSAVSMTPVMVKSRYNVDSDNVNMSAFSFSVDDEKPVLVNVQDSGKELNLDPYTLDVRDLAAGDHTLRAQFWNTAKTNVSYEQIFKVNPVVIPKVQLSAENKDGQVILTFNSIPTGVRWRVIRIDANGVRAKIDGNEQGIYPSTITTVDDAPAGQYTYMVRTVYTDAEGIEHPVNSNEVTMTVTASQYGKFGRISGDVRVGGSPLWGEVWSVTFSDGVTIETDRYGFYHREKIPVGKTLDITVKSRDYYCETKTVTIKEGVNNVSHIGILDEGAVRSRYNNDLQFDSNVELMPRLHMKFKVKNITRLSWHGKLRVVTGRKEYVDNPPKNPFESNDAQILAGSVAPFWINDYYQYDYSDELSIPAGESKDVYIKHNVPITTPPTGKDELYYFFVESVDEYGTKLVAINYEYNIKENPIVQLVDNGQYDLEKDGEAEIENCVNILMGLCSTVTEFDGKLGDMSRCMDEMQTELGYTLDYYDLAGKIERSGYYSYLLDEVPEWEFYKILYYEDRRFLGMVNSVRDKISGEVRLAKDAFGYLKKAKKCIDEVKKYNQWQDMNDLERAGAIADKILNLSEKTFPFAKVLKSYLDVTKVTIRNINKLGRKWDDNHAYMTFRDDGIKFDIRVKKKGWLSSTFDAETVKERILTVEIKAIGHIQGNDPLVCTSTYTPVVQDGKVYLNRVKADGPQPEAGGIVPIEEMWMTIWWSNGRVSYVPIRNSDEMEGNGIKYERNHYTVTFQSKTNKEEYMADIINLDD